MSTPASRLDLPVMQRNSNEAATLMRSLANPSRLLILCVLHEGEMSVGELNRRVELSQSALSQHLAILRRRKLVSTRREAQTIYYRLTDSPAIEVIYCLHRVYCRCSTSPATEGSD